MMEIPMTTQDDRVAEAVNFDPPTLQGQTLQPYLDPPQPASSGVAPSMEAVYDVPIKVQAVLGRARLPIGDLLKLQTGNVLELDRRVGEPVEIFVNNRLIARGEVVMIETVLGVTLTEIVRED